MCVPRDVGWPFLSLPEICPMHGQRMKNHNYQLPNCRHEGKQFILKDIIPGDFDFIISLQKHAEYSPHVRTSVDSIPERHIFVFPYLQTGLLHVDTTALSSAAKKVIIIDALVGLADLHDKHIFHTGQPLSYRIVICVLTCFRRYQTHKYHNGFFQTA